MDVGADTVSVPSLMHHSFIANPEDLEVGINSMRDYISGTSLQTLSQVPDQNIDDMLGLPVDIYAAATADLEPTSSCGKIMSAPATPASDPIRKRTRALMCWRRVVVVTHNTLTPPVLASLLGIIVAFTPLRDWLVDMTQQDKAELAFVYKGMRKLGQTAEIANLIVLGANLAKGPSFAGVSFRFHLAVAFTKMVVMPAVMLGIMFGLAAAGVFHSAGHRTIMLVMMVVSCTPTANNVLVLVELSGHDRNTLSTSIFVQYLLAPFLLTGSLTLISIMLSSGWFPH